MKKEVSSGLIIYRPTEEGPKFLILYHGRGYWNFPKGKIENEERSFEAALRETKEETGLSGKELRILNNFRAYERFTFRQRGRQVFKTVIFYLAETKKKEIRISTREHQGYGWFLYREGSKILGKYQNSQRVLKKANDFLQHRSGQVLQRKSAHGHSPHSSGTHSHLQRGGTALRQPASL